MLGRLLLIFIGVPIIEFYLFWTVGQEIGLPATFATIVLTGILGAWLTKKQGLRTLERYRKAASEGRIPHVEVMDGLMILVAGAVLLTPGFLTDAMGFALLLPPVRAVVRAKLGRYLSDKVKIVTPSPPGQSPPSGDAGARERIIDAKVID